MLLKFLLTGGVVIGAMLALRVVGRAADAKMTRTEDQARDAARRKLKGEDYVKCDRCGAYTSRTDICKCKQKSASLSDADSPRG